MPVDEKPRNTPEQVRLADAIRNQDMDYLKEFEAGQKSCAAGDPLSDETTAAFKDGYVWMETASPDRPVPGIEQPDDFQGDEQTDPEPTPEDDEDEDQFAGTPVGVGFHPLGGVALQARGPDGTVVQARLTVEQAWNLMGHLTSITTMLIQVAYANAAMAAEQAKPNAQDLYIPRR